MFSEIVKLPAPRYDSPTSVEAALCARRSVRDYKDLPLTLAEVSQLLWAAQGITSTRGFRTAPSAGALYPLEVYLEVGKVKELSSGIYKYELFKHELIKYLAGDKRTALANAALRQSCVKNGAVNIIFSAVYERITGKYGERGIRYVYLEAGHAAQNVCLQAVSLGLGAVVVGAFRDIEVQKVVNMPAQEHPLYIIPVGKMN
ncbi:nitroreductase [Peptococcaceae bacterium SCADC1_2_3]|jgi:SagB-type dehydrogenase family enzyme|nr:nitroreductase [Peptococcaceae bacterium SCADC1_2_3]KFI34579.1 nitroreductase [Peptococcaceae bacterium SCADC1_2_3]